MKKINILKEMTRVIDIEIEALQSVRDSMGSQFEAAVRMIAGAKGQVVVTGIGKSGIIANKIAATFRSIGTQSIFIHASEALHGDIGAVGRQDVMIAIGKSGETSDFNDLLRFVKKSGARVISITSKATSTISKQCSWILSHWQSSHDPSRSLQVSRSYGETQISRFRHGWLLLRMVVFAFGKLKAF